MKAGPHGAMDQQRWCRAEAKRRRGRAGGGDAQGGAGPRTPAKMCRAARFLADGEMREAAGLPSPRQVSSPALYSLFPPLLCFRW